MKSAKCEECEVRVWRSVKSGIREASLVTKSEGTPRKDPQDQTANGYTNNYNLVERLLGRTQKSIAAKGDGAPWTKVSRSEWWERVIVDKVRVKAVVRVETIPSTNELKKGMENTRKIRRPMRAVESQRPWSISVSGLRRRENRKGSETRRD